MEFASQNDGRRAAGAVTVRFESWILSPWMEETGIETADHATQLGLGVGWRPELALQIDRDAQIEFVEITAENHPHGLDDALLRLLDRGMHIVVHGIGLSLGGAVPPDPARLARLADLARAARSPLVSEHIAFVRAEGLEAGHLLPVARTRASLEVLVANVRLAQEALDVPLALENIAALTEWPRAEMDEGEFVAEVLERTGTGLLLDVSNLHANARNLGLDPARYLDSLPLARLAYVHVGGGVEIDRVYHDTHAHPVIPAALDLVEEVAARVEIPGIMLERDDDFPPPDVVAAELREIQAAVSRGRARRLR